MVSIKLNSEHFKLQKDSRHERVLEENENKSRFFRCLLPFLIRLCSAKSRRNWHGRTKKKLTENWSAPFFTYSLPFKLKLGLTAVAHLHKRSVKGHNAAIKND